MLLRIIFEQILIRFTVIAVAWGCVNRTNDSEAVVVVRVVFLLAVTKALRFEGVVFA